jgi:O-antigen/teichoic acid export membrane protein
MTARAGVLRHPRVVFALGEASNALTLLLFALVARLLGVELYGRFVALAAVSWILSELADLGFHGLITRAVAQAPQLAWVEARRALRYQAAMTVPVAATLIGYMALTGFPAAMYVPGLLIGLSFIFRSLKGTLRGVCRGLSDFGTESLFQWTERVTLLVASVAALLVKPELLALGIVFFVVRGLDFLAFLAVVWSKVDASGTGHLLPRSSFQSMLSFWISALMASLYYHVSTAMLPVLATTYDAGIYGAFYRFIDLLQVFPRVILLVGFPLLVALWKQDLARFGQTFGDLRRVLTVLGVPMLVGMLLFRSGMLALIFGDAYRVGAQALMYLLIGMFFAFHSMLLAQVLKAAELEASLARAIVLAVLANIGLNVILLPRYGFTGAAVSTLATEVLYYLLLLSVVQRRNVLRVRVVSSAEAASVTLLAGLAWAGSTLASPWLEILSAVGCLSIIMLARPNLSFIRKNDTSHGGSLASQSESQPASR